MAILEIVKMGNPILRETSLKVEDSITSIRFQQFLDDLIATMRMHNGVGIAAPQVGILKRVFTMEIHNNSRYPGEASFPLMVAINPEITYLSNEVVDSWEGCLSIPNIRGKLKRYTHIRLTAYNKAGKRYKTELKGFAAIVAQHELDHLNGVLLIDRMDNMKTLTFKEEYDKFWNK